MPRVVKCSRLVGTHYHRIFFLPGLREEFRNCHQKTDVVIICDDGKFTTFSVFLGAISSGWTDLLRSVSDEVITVSCPGLKVQQFKQIHDLLLRDWVAEASEPVVDADLADIMNLFARDPLDVSIVAVPQKKAAPRGPQDISTVAVPQKKAVSRDPLDIPTVSVPQNQADSRPILKPEQSRVDSDRTEDESDEEGDATESKGVEDEVDREMKKVVFSTDLRPQWKPPEVPTREVKAIKLRMSDMFSSKRERPKVISCGLCDKKYISHRSLYDHMATHHGERKFQCSRCDKRFATGTELTSHLRCHPKQARTLRHKCSHCEKSFHGDSHLQNHMRRAHYEHSDKKIFACHICMKTFRDSSGLRKHKITHTKTRPWKCKLCPKTFKTKSVLNTHIRTHSDHKAFCCSHCGARFHTAGSMNAHVKTQHLKMEEERKYLCTECGGKFLRPYNLKVHMRTHTGEEPYKCNICAKTFKIPQKLRDHMRMHTGEKPFKCRTCDKRFRAAGSLAKHFKGNPLCKQNAGPGAYSIPKQSHLPKPNTFIAMDVESIERHPDTERYLALLGGNKLPILREKLEESQSEEKLNDSS